MNQKSFILKILLVYAYLLLSFSLKSEAIPLSSQARISLITVSPGAELYSMYGHSAIRVVDPANFVDIVFNYGTFDFNTPNFYVKFVRGKLPYQLSAGYYEQLKNKSIEDNRSVYEQEINLTQPQKQVVMNFLEKNYLPENRSYLYDFFFDNCATRIRDVFSKNMPQQVQFAHKIPGEQLSFRQLVGIYQAPHPWVDLGVDLVMGLPSDRLATPLEYMFLPDYLLLGFKQASIMHPDTTGTKTTRRAFAPKTVEVFKATVAPAQDTFFTPIIVFWALFVAGVLFTFWQIKRRKTGHSLDFILFGLTGLLGCILLFLWLGTDHQSFSQNLNVLWAFPLHLPMAFLLWRRNRPSFLRIYFLIIALVLVIIAISWKFLPQEFHPSVFPIVLLLIMRAWYIFRSSKKSNRSTSPYKY